MMSGLYRGYVVSGEHIRMACFAGAGLTLRLQGVPQVTFSIRRT